MCGSQREEDFPRGEEYTAKLWAKETSSQKSEEREILGNATNARLTAMATKQNREKPNAGNGGLIRHG